MSLVKDERIMKLMVNKLQNQILSIQQDILDCQFLALKLWMHLHSSMQMKQMYANME